MRQCSLISCKNFSFRTSASNLTEHVWRSRMFMVHSMVEKWMESSSMSGWHVTWQLLLQVPVVHCKTPKAVILSTTLGMMQLIETRMNTSNCLPVMRKLLITYLLCSLVALANRSWELRDKLSHARRGHFPAPPQHVPGMSEFSYLQLATYHSGRSVWNILGIHRLFFFANIENPEKSYVI